MNIEELQLRGAFEILMAARANVDADAETDEILAKAVSEVTQELYGDRPERGRRLNFSTWISKARENEPLQWVGIEKHVLTDEGAIKWTEIYE